ncbi:DUF3139 domain-containing protein [Oceanobacillus halotolerans]|uniref:DUF3139 domain-containing protein n=1 Tax=Oceanobacillus halotolerans TaxID=2663380 RepID=UPI0013DBD07A|nr:DUF3139 domain-containing protein [Oceanobacillus halotolerans]
MELIERVWSHYDQTNVIILIVLSVLVLLIGIRLLVVHIEEGKLKEDTISYLEEKGYDPNADIKEIAVVDIGEDEEMNAVVVTFIDEPTVDYFYTYEKDTTHI